MAYVIRLFCVCLCVSLVNCQFGFYSQRDERRYPSFQQGINNLLTAPKRLTERLTGIFHVRQENQYSNPAFIFPFRRPGIATDSQNNYQYQNGQNNGYNQGGYGFHNPSQGYGYNDYQNYGYNENNGNPVAFPTSRPDGTAVNVVNNNNGQYTESNPDNNSNTGTGVNVVDNSNGQYTETNPTNNKNDVTAVNFVDNSNGQYTESNPPNNKNDGTAVNFVDNSNGQYTESNPPNDKNDGTAVNFVDNSNGQYTESNPSNNKYDGTAVNFVDNSNGQYIESNPYNNNNQNKDDMNQNGHDKQEGKGNEDSSISFEGTETGVVFPNVPAPGFNKPPPPNNGIPNTPPAGIPSEPPAGIPNVPPPGMPDVPPTGLQVLTPVPDTEKRNNFNFGAAGLFKETCETIDQNLGTCISILQCRPYLGVLKNSQNNPQAVQILRRAHCGFEGNNPKVCCPLSSIPSVPPTEPTTTTTTTTPPNPDPQTPTELDPEDRVGAFLEPPMCGFSNASFSRVVGGVKAKLADFPWMALLGYKRGTSTRWLCGGSLISSKHVLTAAHCIHGHEADLYLVRLGELDLERDDEGATPVDVLIKQQIKHEQYSPTAFTNDIGILVLDKQVSFTDLIRPICIPKDSELRARSFENYTPIIAGWGDTEFRGPSASHLQALQLPVVSNDFCADAYKNYKNQQIDERVLCAGYKQGGKDACQGDSGGPLMQPIWNTKDYTTHFYQIGVVSFGRKCAEAGFPGVYTRVTHFVPWLERTIVA